MKKRALRVTGVLVLLLTLALACPRPGGATMLAVTDCGDSGGPGQLRAVIAAATSGDTVAIPACTITLGTQVTITANLAITGAGAAQTTIDGGSITRIFTISAVTVTISDVTLRHGSAPGGLGGAVRVQSGSSLVLTRSRVADSQAGAGIGGGIESEGSLTLVNSTVTGNFGGLAGGGISASGPLTLINSTISGNSASVAGGINTGAGAVTLTNSTISGNTATSVGGGLLVNGPGTVTVKNTIIANNTAPTNANCQELPISQGHNLESANTCGFTALGDLVNTDPKLGPLQDNGGPTPTQALLPGSPAIDAGDNAGCPSTDQRGIARPQDGDEDGVAKCDIGAFEALPTSLTISPPSGRYVNTQGFDLVLVVGPLGQAIVGGRVTVDGVDVTAALARCVVPGTLLTGGFTARCPNLRGSLLQPGTHTVGVTLDLSDGTARSATVQWEVDANTEP